MENNFTLKESYNYKYLLNYSNLIKELNKHKKTYKTILKIAIIKNNISITGLINYDINNISIIDSIDLDIYNDSIDIYNFIKEFYNYNIEEINKNLYSIIIYANN